MRKTILLIILAMNLQNLHAQDYIINFEATGASTSLDSVKAYNHGQDSTLIISGTDQIRLVFLSGEREINASQSKEIKLYPNPADDNTVLDFYAKARGKATISLFNILGEPDAEKQNDLAKGIHQYRINGLSAGNYIVRVTGPAYSLVSKLISTGNTKDKAIFLEYLAFSPGKKTVPAGIGTNILKSIQSQFDMPYQDGEDIVYTGYANGVFDKISDIPKENKTIQFYFVSSCPVTVTDYDGNSYNVVKIGNQCWMGKSLETTHYADGTAIPQVTGTTGWSNLEKTDKAWCYYDNSASMGDTYGVLYTWAAAINGTNGSYSIPSGIQGVCPDGWHLPSTDEWLELDDFVSLDGHDGFEATALMATSGWFDEPGTDNYNFSGLPGGYRSFDGTFHYEEFYGYWWSASGKDWTSLGTSFGLQYNYTDVFISSEVKQKGFSVRCVQD